MILDNLMFNVVFNQVLAEDHPTRRYDNCINKRQTKNKCEVCKDVCPQQVYSGVGNKLADYASCSNCNLCVTACPARCIAPSAMNASAFLKLLDSPEKTVVIATKAYEGNAHLHVSSFAALSWEYLAALALGKRVVFLSADAPEMTQCEADIWRETRAKLIVFYGKAAYKARFVFLDQPDASMAEQLSRRQVIGKVGGELKSRITPMVSSGSDMDGLLYRRVLHRRLVSLKNAGAPMEAGWLMPMISDKCTGCGVCEKLCPQQAITVRKDGAGFGLVLDPARCNACGLCKKACIKQAIEDWGIVPIQSLAPVMLYKKKAE